VGCNLFDTDRDSQMVEDSLGGKNCNPDQGILLENQCKVTENIREAASKVPIKDLSDKLEHRIPINVLKSVERLSGKPVIQMVKELAESASETLILRQAPISEGRVGGKADGIRPTDPPFIWLDNLPPTAKNIALLSRGDWPYTEKGREARREQWVKPIPKMVDVYVSEKGKLVGHHFNQRNKGPIIVIGESVHHKFFKEMHPKDETEIDRAKYKGQRHRACISKTRELLGQEP